MQKIVAGIDIGGTGMKGALVDAQTGEMLTERLRILTPQPATPHSVSLAVKDLLRQLDWQGPVGVGFPSIIHKNVAQSAENISKEWIGVDIARLFEETCGMPFAIANDADAAGMAEMLFGNIDKQGVSMFLTIGTGIGSGLFLDGKLVPNTEMGHLIFYGDIAEKYCSNAARKRYKLSTQRWAQRFKQYLLHLNRLFSPDRYIIGGGMSNKFEDFEKYIQTGTPVYSSQFKNAAGVIGAAAIAADRLL
jgi:polyphosphate glucokinase